MASLLDLLKKGGNALKDAFTFTEEEKASGKTPSVLEKIPMRTAEARDNVSAFFAPAPDKTRVRDVVRELPGATGDVAKEIAQGTARSFDFVGRKIQEPVGKLLGIDTELDRSESTKLEDILYGGRDKRVDTLAERGEVEFGLDADKSPILAPVVGFGLTALDFVPGGQGKGKAVKNLAEEAPKFKTAKDFARGILDQLTFKTDKEIPIYRGEGSGIGNSTFVNGRYFADSEDFAKQFGDVTQETLPAGTKVFDFDLIKNNRDQRVIDDALLREPERLTSYLIDNGITVTKNTNSRGVEYVFLKKKPLEEMADVAKTFRNKGSFLNYIASEGFEKYKPQMTALYNQNGTGVGDMIWNASRNKGVGGNRLKPANKQLEDIWRKAVKTKGNVARETAQRGGSRVGTEQTVSVASDGTGPTVTGKVERVDVDSLKPRQATEDIFNETSEGYARGDIVENLYQANERPVNVGKLTDPEQLPVIVVNEDGVIIDGHHRWGASQIAGLKEIDVIRVSNKEAEALDSAVDRLVETGDVAPKLIGTPEELAEAKVELAKKMTVNEVPREYQPEVSKSLNKAEAETKKLSERRLRDAEKYGISEDVMARMLYSKAGGRLSHVEASNLADTIKAPIKDLLEKDAQSFPLNRPKIEAYSQELQGYFNSVVKRLKAEAEAHPDDSILREQYQTASQTYMKARTTLEAIITEAGRVVEGSKVIGKYSRLPGMDGKIKQVRNQIVKFAEKNPKHADLPTEFDMALETVDVNNATQLMDFLTQWNRASFLQKLSEFQKASLLSALSTHAVNALGNSIQMVLDIPVRALAGGLDTVRAGVTRTPREVFAGESLAQVRGAFRSAPSAFQRAWKALQNEHYALELRRTEIEAGMIVPAIRGRFGKVVRLPFRLLQMADLGFRTLNKGAETDALAVRIAKLEGLKGKAYKDRVKELRQNIPEDMLGLIDERAERALMLEELPRMLKSIESFKNEYPIMQFVIPFYRTLVNLSREAYRMTPIGGLGRTAGRLIPGQSGRNLTEAFSNKWTKNQSTRMEELSRQIMGTGIMTWVVSGMLNGDIEITGPAPRDAGERETFYGQGKLPHAIRWGDTWVEFQRVQPIGQLLQIGSSISEAIEAYKNTGQLDSESVEKEMFNSISDIGSMVFTQSPFTGMADLFALLQGGAYNEGYIKAGNRYIGQMMGTFIPNVLRRLTVASDPIIYEKRDIPSQLKSRVPGLQKSLTPRRDTFGEIVRQGGNFASRFASPIRTTEAIEGSLYDELDEIGYSPTVPNRQAFGEDLSVKEYETLRKYYGPRFRDELWATVNDPAYKSLNKEQKQDVVSGISRKVMTMARQELFPIYAEKNELRKMWEQQGYTPLVIEDALQAKYPYDKETLETYAEAILDRSIQSGDARETIENLLKK